MTECSLADVALPRLQQALHKAYFDAFGLPRLAPSSLA
jgi:hypothetical protein